MVQVLKEICQALKNFLEDLDMIELSQLEFLIDLVESHHELEA